MRRGRRWQSSDAAREYLRQTWRDKPGIREPQSSRDEKLSTFKIDVSGLKPRQPAGWQRRSRRSGPGDVRSGTARCAEMYLPVASHLPWRPAERLFPETGRTTENGRNGLTSRDAYENSNARVVRAPFGSGIIAMIAPAAGEIFSADLSRTFGTEPAPERTGSRPPRPTSASRSRTCRQSAPAASA